MKPRAIVFLVVCLVLCAAVGYTQIPDLWLSGDEMNGNDWQSMSPRERIIYLHGLRESFYQFAPADRNGHDWFPSGSYDEVSSALDKDYLNRYRLDIPVIQELRIIRDRQAENGKKR